MRLMDLGFAAGIAMLATAAMAQGPYQVAKRDYEYERCGTANVFCAVEPKAGQHYTRPTPDRCAAEFAQIMAELALNYPTVQTIHLVVDNLNIHCRKSLTDHYGDIPGTNLWNRFTVHYTLSMVAG